MKTFPIKPQMFVKFCYYYSLVFLSVPVFQRVPVFLGTPEK